MFQMSFGFLLSEYWTDAAGSVVPFAPVLELAGEVLAGLPARITGPDTPRTAR